MSVLGGSDSAVKQSTQNAPLSASDQAVLLSLRGSSVLGDKNSGNIDIRKGGTYAPQITYTTTGYTAEDLDRVRGSFQESLSAAITGLGQARQLGAGRTLPDVIEDRIAGQITDAPEDAAKEKRNFTIIIIAMLAIAGGALFLGRKS